jgi:hypothetical protein
MSVDQGRLESVPVLVVSGTVGVGKSTVVAAIHDLLAEAEVAHACIERDAIACSWPERGAFNRDTVWPNLASLWTNFRRAGAGRLVFGGVVEDVADVAACRRAVPGAQVVVCLLVAAEVTRVARLRGRETGAGLAWHLARTVELQEVLMRAAVHDFAVSNEAGRGVRAVALEVLAQAGWPVPGSGSIARGQA